MKVDFFDLTLIYFGCDMNFVIFSILNAATVMFRCPFHLSYCYFYVITYTEIQNSHQLIYFCFGNRFLVNLWDES